MPQWQSILFWCPKVPAHGILNGSFRRVHHLHRFGPAIAISTHYIPFLLRIHPPHISPLHPSTPLASTTTILPPRSASASAGRAPGGTSCRTVVRGRTWLSVARDWLPLIRLPALLMLTRASSRLLLLTGGGWSRYCLRR